MARPMAVRSKEEAIAALRPFEGEDMQGATKHGNGRLSTR